MLSILIPIYNYNVIPLIETLFNEVSILDDELEIVCIDDASDMKFKEINSDLKRNKNCIYEELSVNIGRSRIRNLLAQKAKYKNLLFLDCDVIPSTNNFIKNYMKSLENHDIVFGGVRYLEDTNKNRLLHYKYGKERETKLEFITQNFAIKKKIFDKIKFDESIDSYGYEDLVFYKSLKKKGLLVYKVDNTVSHLGIIEDNEVYIKKEEESLNTLKRLYNQKKISREDVKLLKYFSFLKSTKTLKIYKLIFSIFKKLLLKNLTSKSPSLFLFDVYRLGYFSKL